jgi:hypothetical protein
MTYTLRFLPEVEDDAISGYSWYESKSPGLGEEFLRMFYACVGDIPRNPHVPQSSSRIQTLPAPALSYAIYFIINDNQIIVTGLFHGARDPRTIESMLRNRIE